MGSLFSIFDPVSSISYFRLNWLSIIRFILFFPSLYFLISRKLIKIYNLISIYLLNEFRISIGKTNTPGIGHFLISMFILILFCNFLGLFPYIFTPSRHLVLTINLALPVWLGYMIYSIRLNINFFLSQLVPLGTPYPLIIFIVLIEIIRSVIRPLTLSVRLAANIVAGHLLIVLIRGPIRSVSWTIFLFCMLGLLILIILELAVSFIQSYVFSTLLSLYIFEVNSPNF